MKKKIYREDNTTTTTTPEEILQDKVWKKQQNNNKDPSSVFNSLYMSNTLNSINTISTTEQIPIIIEDIPFNIHLVIAPLW